MKKTANTIHRASALLLSAAVLCGAVSAALPAAASAAADAPSLDFTQSANASITVNLQAEDGSSVTGGEFTLYQVADLSLEDGNMTYTYTEAFAALADDAKYSLDTLGESDTATALLARYIAGWVSENDPEPLAAQTNQASTIVFETTEGEYTIALGLYLIVQTAPFDGYETITPFLVTVPLAAEENGSSYWDYTVDATPKMETIVEKETESESETESEKETEPQTETAQTESESETEKLPQTGQLNWPIPLLCTGGVLLIAAGIIMTLSGRRNQNHDA